MADQPVRLIRASEEDFQKAQREVQRLINSVEAGTTGDHAAAGALHEILDALGAWDRPAVYLDCEED